MSTIALIPARGGSKRIPRKNIKEFCGKPMIAHSILEAAQKSELFERIIVSTDDEEIAKISVSLGAEVPFIRPDHLSNDHATTADVIIHAINWLTERNQSPKHCCCIYATAPFVESSDLKKGHDILTTSQWTTVFSATTFPSQFNAPLN